MDLYLDDENICVRMLNGLKYFFCSQKNGLNLQIEILFNSNLF